MADTLKIKLEHCYGIGNFDADLKFKHKGFAIYAPNGVMKTSFAQTMMDLSEGKQPKDLAFPDRESSANITLNDEPIRKEDIFVVQSYDAKFASNEVSTLLANTDLKNRYEQVHKAIGNSKQELDKRLKSLAGFSEKSRENLDPIVESIFNAPYYDALVEIEEELSQLKETDFSNADYKILFDPKVKNLLEDQDVGTAVHDFARKYDEITKSSPILRQNFQFHNASQIQQQLKANNFFAAGHSVSLMDENTQAKSELSSDKSFSETIEAEKERILQDAEVKAKFEAFNAKLKNKELQAFRDYITENQHLLPKLENLEKFQRELWLQYLLKSDAEYKALIVNYKSGREKLNQIISEANESRSDWDDVIADFNRRFLYLPFELTIENKSDTILKGTSPSVGFIFRDAGEEKHYTQNQKQDLLRVLSTGEARALYILDIMYEFYVRWKYRKKTLFVFDDIADSFDYKNKFAIIDFLEDITKPEDTNFLAIILTHNFDFFRTIESRGICQAHQCRLAYRTDDGIKLEEFKRSDIRSPFERWRSKLDDSKIMIAFIPFMRNVIEYTQGTKDADGNPNLDYLTLTKMVHYKDETETLTISDYKSIFCATFPNDQFPEINETQNILHHILQTADECTLVEDGINLEHKIVLSIATRILAERFMLQKIRTNEQDYDVSQKQTGNLFQDFKEQFNNLTGEISTLKRVSLITPANIHINAFMYEPILDMGFGELVSLYNEVKEALV